MPLRSPCAEELPAESAMPTHPVAALLATAGVADITERLDQGFEVIIVTEAEAVAVGMAHSGRG